MDLQSLTTVVLSFPRRRVLVVGDLMLDEYIWGHVNRISQEAPVPIVDIESQEYRLGGSGNVVANLVSLEARATAVGVVGEDAEGDRLVKLIEESGAQASGVLRDPARPTTHKRRVLSRDRNQLIARLDRETRQTLGAAQEEELVQRIKASVADSEVVVVSDYHKGVLTPRVSAATIEAAADAGIPVVVDPKGAEYTKYRGATALTPNLQEAELATGISVVNERDVEAVGAALLKITGARGVFITRGAHGITLATAAGSVTVAAEAQDVYDVTGAGDTVAAVVGLSLAAGGDLELAARIANTAAGVAVGKVGTATVLVGEILSTWRARDNTKHLPVEELAALLAAHKRAGRSVVFTNGCFDILHAGHLKVLRGANMLGDVVVVAVNSDSSVRRLKGRQRPFVTLDERMQLVAALDFVDHVVPFDEDTPLKIIERLQPDVLVKGGDYSPDGVIGKEIVEAHGGRVEIVPLLDGVSTSRLADQIRRPDSRSQPDLDL